MLAVVKFLNCIIATTVKQQIIVMSIITYKIIIQICPELGFILMIFFGYSVEFCVSDIRQMSRMVQFSAHVLA